MLGVSNANSLPKICIVGEKEMLSNASAAYNAIDNVLYLNEKYDKIEKAIEYKKQMACPNNPLSTMLHETFHWKDAQEYIAKNGNITSLAKLNEYENLICKKKLDDLAKTGYNILNISDYATDMYHPANAKYYETYTEYRVKKLLEG